MMIRYSSIDSQSTLDQIIAAKFTVHKSTYVFTYEYMQVILNMSIYIYKYIYTMYVCVYPVYVSI